MSDRRIEKLTGRLERLERQGRLMKVGGLGLLAVLGAAAFSGPDASEERPDRPGNIRVEKIEFVDVDGQTRAVLTVEDGPFVVRDCIPRCYRDSRGGEYTSFDVRTRTVPELADLTAETLEQMARDFKCKPDELARMLQESQMPALVLSDAKERPRGIIETSQIDPGLPRKAKD